MAQRQGGGDAAQPQFNWRQLLSQVLLGVLLYGIYNRTFGSSGKPAASAPIDPHGQPLLPHSNIMPPNMRMDLWVFKSEKNESADLSSSSPDLLWLSKGLIYDSWEDGQFRTHTVKFSTSQALQNNGSLFAHIYFVKAGYKSVEEAIEGSPIVLHKVHPLTKFLPVSKPKLKNLLGGESDTPAEPQKKKILSHWKGNVTITLVQDRTPFPRGGVPQQIQPYMSYDPTGRYYPILFCNEFWLLREQLSVLNDTVTEVTLDIAYEPLSFLKFSMYTQFEQSFSIQRDMLGGDEGESEEFKHMLLDNHPYMLALTFFVSLLHMVFDYLAFKNDIQFWSSRQTMEGLSVRTIYINTISSIIIFFYLLDNETSWMILASAGVGMVIDAWKITRAVNVSIVWYGSIPWIKLSDKSTYVSQTKVFDEEAMKYLAWLLLPLVGGYSVYSLVYESHKSWYSWVISSLAGTVYTFGFIMMTPQLFINYKLKSVAHLPWRTFVYKALNTFIDDLFAFIIRQPTLSRLRVFRDDIVFIIYLYQRWIYPVDKNRLDVPGDGPPIDISGSNKQDGSKPSETKPKTE